MSIPATASGCLACPSSSNLGSHGHWAARRAAAFTCAAKPLILAFSSPRHPLQLAGPEAPQPSTGSSGVWRERDSSELQQGPPGPGRLSSVGIAHSRWSLACSSEKHVHAMWLKMTARAADKRMRLQGMLLAHNHSPFLSCPQAAVRLMACHLCPCTVQHAAVEGAVLSC